MAWMTTSTHDEHERLGPTRRRVLAQLQEQPEPMAIETLGSDLGLHPNTVRFHLEGLFQDDLVRKLTEKRGRKGRPRVLFTAVPSVPPVSEVPYRELVEALLANVRAGESDDPGLAERIGNAWGRSIGGAATPETALDELVAVVNRLGLSSRLTDSDDGGRLLEIVRCPFREMTIGGDSTVCRIHLGMMRGYLEAAGTPDVVESLLPWVEPELCVAQFGPGSADPLQTR